MNALALEDDEKSAIRLKLESAVEKAKDTCERLQAKTVATAKAADKVVREHPYQAIGIGFALGLLVGALAMRKRKV